MQAAAGLQPCCVHETVLYDRQRKAACPDLCVLFSRSYSLPVRDRMGRKWEFVIKSWANGTENRRVYVLEQTGEFLKVHTRFHTTQQMSHIRLACHSENLSSSVVLVQGLLLTCKTA